MWGARLMALPSTSRCLGASWFETFLRSACLEWLCQTLCSYAGYLGVSTLHKFKINITLSSFIVNNLFMRCTFQRFYWVSSDTGHWWLEASSRSARQQGLLEVGPARLLAAMLGDRGVSTLRSIKTMTWFSSLLSIKPAMPPASMLGDYSTSASSTPSCFPRHTDLLGNPFLITSLLDLLSSSLLFFGSSTGHLARHDAWIILYKCIFDAL
jgi:hypothetical protein